MAKNIQTYGYFLNDLTYKRSGYDLRPLVILQGLTGEHKLQAMMRMM